MHLNLRGRTQTDRGHVQNGALLEIEPQGLHRQALAEALHGKLGGGVDVVEKDSWREGSEGTTDASFWWSKSEPRLRRPSLTLNAHDAADDHNVALLPPLHVRQDLLQQPHQPEEVGVHYSPHLLHGLTLDGSDQTHAGVADWEGNMEGRGVKGVR